MAAPQEQSKIRVNQEFLDKHAPKFSAPESVKETAKWVYRLKIQSLEEVEEIVADELFHCFRHGKPNQEVILCTDLEWQAAYKRAFEQMDDFSQIDKYFNIPKGLRALVWSDIFEHLVLSYPFGKPETPLPKFPLDFYFLAEGFPVLVYRSSEKEDYQFPEEDFEDLHQAPTDEQSKHLISEMVKKIDNSVNPYEIQETYDDMVRFGFKLGTLLFEKKKSIEGLVSFGYWEKWNNFTKLCLSSLKLVGELVNKRFEVCMRDKKVITFTKENFPQHFGYKIETKFRMSKSDKEKEAAEDLPKMAKIPKPKKAASKREKEETKSAPPAKKSRKEEKKAASIQIVDDDDEPIVSEKERQRLNKLFVDCSDVGKKKSNNQKALERVERASKKQDKLDRQAPVVTQEALDQGKLLPLEAVMEMFRKQNEQMAKLHALILNKEGSSVSSSTAVPVSPLMDETFIDQDISGPICETPMEEQPAWEKDDSDDGGSEDLGSGSQDLME